MLSSISWQQYFSAVLIVMIIFYVVIFAFYYKTEYRQFIQQRKNKADGLPGRNDKQTLADELHTIVEELNVLFVSGHPWSASQLKSALQNKLRQYSVLRDSPYKAEIDKHIISESREQCSIHLSEEDLRVLWK